MVRSHKKAKHRHSGGGGGGGGGSASRKKRSHEAAVAVAASGGAVAGWSQRDYQQAAAAAAATGDDDAPASPPAPTPSHPRSSRKKKRAHTPAWMRDPDEPTTPAAPADEADETMPASATMVRSASSSSGSSSSLMSTCWNHLPRDCLLHVFSFHALFPIVRMTCISHHWHRCLKRGLMNRVVEASFKILCCKKATMLCAVGTPKPATLALPSLSTIISPLFDDVDDVAMSDNLDELAPTRATSVVANVLTSPALSALPPSAALKSNFSLSMSGGTSFPSSPHTLGAPFSSSSTLFKAAMVHLDSLYLGQKQLHYSLHSNPLFQHLHLLYHVSCCHQRVLDQVRRIHVAVYRNANAGKWPRNTKANQSAMGAIESQATDANANTYDLMPHHLILDASLHHRDAFLSQLHSSQKHLWTFLHDQPPREVFGFTGTSLYSVQLAALLTRMEAKLEEQLKRQKLETKSRYKTKRPAAQPHGPESLREDGDAPVPREDARTYIAPLSSSTAPLLSSADAHALYSVLRRMSELSRLWGTYLHSDASAPSKNAADSDADEITPASPSISTSAASVDRAWDPIGLGWRAQHQRLARLEHFWSRMAEHLTANEKAEAMRQIASQQQRARGTDAASPLVGTDELVAAAAIVAGDKRKREDEPDASESQTVPPASRLVGIETNPGPTGSETSSSSTVVSATPALAAAPSAGRWRLLKRALVKSDANAAPAASADAASVRRHAGFKVLQVGALVGAELAEALKPLQTTGNGSFAAGDTRRFQFVRYLIPSTTTMDSPSPSLGDGFPLHFRIRRPESVSLLELSPAQRVDNTGNICVWNSEEVLAHVALQIVRAPFAVEGEGSSSSPTSLDGTVPPLQRPLLPRPSGSTRPLRVLELGSGMSGLCGLTLAYAHCAANASTASSSADLPTIGEVLITDGNSACIEDGVAHQIAWNQVVHSQLIPPPAAVSSNVLAWDRTADYSHMDHFDAIFVADCLFFRDYHLDLCAVLRSLLTPETGRAFLLAPHRGGSLQAFVDVVQQASTSSGSSLRVVSLAERYDPVIWSQHQQFLAEAAASQDAAYSPDLHYPLLLTLATHTTRTH